MAGDKYKVKITNVGVGDPFILFNGYFENTGTPPDGGTWTLPSVKPLTDLTLNISLCNGDGGTNPDLYTSMGSISIKNIGTENIYLFGLPFDKGNFVNGDTLSVYVTLTDGEGNSIYIYGDNEDDTHVAWFQVMNLANDTKTFGPLEVYYNWEDQ